MRGQQLCGSLDEEYPIGSQQVQEPWGRTGLGVLKSWNTGLVLAQKEVESPEDHWAHSEVRGVGRGLRGFP